MTKTYIVEVKQVLEIALDENMYSEEVIEQYEDYWDFEFLSREDALEEIVRHIAYNYHRDGFFDQEAEGLVKNSFSGKYIDFFMNVKEKGDNNEIL